MFVHILISLLSNFILFYFSDYIPRRVLNYSGFLTIFFIGIISLSIEDYENNSRDAIFIFILSCFNKFIMEMIFSNYFVYLAEIFPT